MIKVFVFSLTGQTENKEGFVISPTLFPDGTSQVWKLDENLISELKDPVKEITVVWYFESDSEIVYLSSLCTLLRHITGNKHSRLKLFVPFLPGARQDKLVSNNQTFNRAVYAGFINALNFDQVTVLDAHSDIRGVIDRVWSVHPEDFHLEVKELEPENTVIVYPDHGAFIRYYHGFRASPKLLVDKERDPLTGAITSSRFHESEMNSEWNNFLIVDDICDGGATFIGVAELIKRFYPEAKISLAVTHGIFSRGLQPLIEAGIQTVYTTDSLIRNTNSNSDCLHVIPTIKGVVCNA